MVGLLICLGNMSLKLANNDIKSEYVAKIEKHNTMRTELGNLMATEPDVSALTLLGYRIEQMRKEMDEVKNVRDGALEALRRIEEVFTDGSDAYEDRNVMGVTARDYLFSIK